MNFNKYLRNARERANITQTEFAERVGVSTTTVQNWESGTLPDKNHWETIIKQLKLSKEDFIKYYANAILPEEKTYLPKPFPDFLYPEKLLDKIKKLRLTADEQELLGLETIYGGYEVKEDHSFTVSFSTTLPHLPYDYIRRMGAFNAMNLHDSLIRKTDGYRDYIIKHIKAQPDDEPFDIIKCSPEQLLDLCNFISVEHKHAYYGKAENYYAYIMRVIELLDELERNNGSETVAVCKGDYHFPTWNKLPNYNTFFDYNNEIKYKPYICLVERECQDKEYVESKEKYERDKLFYEEHSSMIDHAPEKPKFKGTRDIEITNTGQQLLDWYQLNFERDE